jgi:molecular chaperone GrpE
MKKPTETKRKRETEIGRLKKRLAETEDNWKRAVADYKNLEARLAKEREEITRLANTVLMTKFLDVFDDLRRARDHCPDEGLDMVIKQFNSVLLSEGVEEIEAEGRKFDPYCMDCVGTVREENIDDETVVEVIKKGYLYRDGRGFEQVLRPAEVIVNKKEK